MVEQLEECGWMEERKGDGLAWGFCHRQSNVPLRCGRTIIIRETRHPQNYLFLFCFLTKDWQCSSIFLQAGEFYHHSAPDNDIWEQWSHEFWQFKGVTVLWNYFIKFRHLLLLPPSKKKFTLAIYTVIMHTNAFCPGSKYGILKLSHFWIRDIKSNLQIFS